MNKNVKCNEIVMSKQDRTCRKLNSIEHHIRRVHSDKCCTGHVQPDISPFKQESKRQFFVFEQ